MMQTRTVFYNADELAPAISDMEAAGWAVRQILTQDIISWQTPEEPGTGWHTQDIPATYIVVYERPT